MTRRARLFMLARAWPTVMSMELAWTWAWGAMVSMKRLNSEACLRPMATLQDAFETRKEARGAASHQASPWASRRLQ